MDNRPVSIKEPIVFFRKSNAAFKINYQEGFDMPEKIEIEFWSDRVKVDIGPEVTAQISGNTAEFDVPVEVIRILPPQLEAYFLHDGDFLFAGKVFVQMGAAENPSIMELSVSVGSDQIINVEVIGLELVRQQVEITIQNAAQTADDRVATGEDRVATAADRVQTGQDATTATTKAGEAAGSATAALNAQTATEAARDQVVGPLATKMDLYKADTFAAMQQFIDDEQPEACMFLVLADETYSGLPRFHGYTKLPTNPIVQLVSY